MKGPIVKPKHPAMVAAATTTTNPPTKNTGKNISIEIPRSFLNMREFLTHYLDKLIVTAALPSYSGLLLRRHHPTNRIGSASLPNSTGRHSKTDDGKCMSYGYILHSSQ